MNTTVVSIEIKTARREPIDAAIKAAIAAAAAASNAHLPDMFMTGVPNDAVGGRPDAEFARWMAPGLSMAAVHAARMVYSAEFDRWFNTGRLSDELRMGARPAGGFFTEPGRARQITALMRAAVKDERALAYLGDASATLAESDHCFYGILERRIVLVGLVDP
jgi:hypothetical protein